MTEFFSGSNCTRVVLREAARKNGPPGAIVPGIMRQGILVALIHRWAPNALVLNVCTAKIKL